MNTIHGRTLSSADEQAILRAITERTRAMERETEKLRAGNARRKQDAEFQPMVAAKVASRAVDMLQSLHSRGVTVPELNQCLAICRDAAAAGIMTAEQGSRLLDFLPAVREAEDRLGTAYGHDEAMRRHYLGGGYRTKDLRPDNWPHR